MKKSKINRGGYREGAGRIPDYGVSMERYMIRIPPQHTATLKEVHPSISKAIRNILDDPETLTAIQKLIERNRANAT